VSLVGLIIICSVVAFAGAFWIISAWLDHKLRGAEAVLLLLGLLIVAFLAMAMQGAGIVLLIGAVFGVAAGLHALARRSDRHLVNSFDEEDIARYRAGLELDPKNVAAHSLLADTYRRMGRLEMAIDEYRAALELDPSLRAERYWVQRLEAELERRGHKEMACPRCGTPRPPGAQVCPECDRRYSTAETSLHAVRMMRPAQKLACAASGAVVLVGLAAVTALAPSLAAYSAIALSFLVPLGIILLSIRASRRTG
jgi:hypothetical protein